MIVPEKMKLNIIPINNQRSLTPLFSTEMITAQVISFLTLVLILILSWPKKDHFKYIWQGEGPLTFFGVFVIALVINSYINLRCGHGELSQRVKYPLAKRKEKTITYEQDQNFYSYGVVIFLLHTMLLLLPLIPIFLISAGISGISPIEFITAFLIFFVTSFFCRMFGFMIYLAFKKWDWPGFLLTRCFYICLFLATALFGVHLNPILLIYDLYKGEKPLATGSLSTSTVYIVLIILFIGVLTLVNQIMVARGITRRRDVEAG
jgi:hypothetical protein